MITRTLPGLDGCSTNSWAFCDVVERELLRDVKALPAGFECAIDVLSGFTLRFGRNIITADEEQSGVNKDELPDGDFSDWSVGGIGGDGTALRQDFDVGLDIGGKGHFYDVINTVGSRPVDVLFKGCVCKEDLIRAGARRDVLIALGTASGDHGPAGHRVQLIRRWSLVGVAAVRVS